MKSGLAKGNIGIRTIEERSCNKKKSECIKKKKNKIYSYLLLQLYNIIYYDYK